MAVDREIYPSAPLQLVSFELRFPHAPGLTTAEGFGHIHRAVRDLFPIVEPGLEAELVIGPQGALPASSRPMSRFLSRDRYWALTVASSQFIVETTAYDRYEEFRERLQRALAALADTQAIAGALRIGLRYIDEIRLRANVEKVESWSAYVRPELLCGTGMDAGPYGAPDGVSGVLHYAGPPGFQAAMRYGALRGRTVGDQGPLQLRRQTHDGPYFLIDIDSYWQPTTRELEVFRPEDSLAISDQLRLPIRNLFEASITDRLRDEVLRQTPSAKEA